jgi:TM2 domain-containing membrane protein YozV
MSEETTNTATDAVSSERAGYCQDCGKPLTRETVRIVGTGVFCESCLATRIGATPAGYPSGAAAGWQQGQPQGTQPGAAQPGTGAWGIPWSPASAGNATSGFTPAPSTHLPNPTLAGLLGVIPGVGAMYNGQLVKGLLHLAIFAILVVLQNNVSGIFGLFVAGWVLYQIFDAYHTARARRDGTPLPNLFGINDLADRLSSGQGFGTPPSTPGAPVQPPVTGPTTYGGYNAPPASATPPPPPPAGAAGWNGQAGSSVPSSYAPPAQAGYGVPPANWAGYAHPTTFAVPSPPPPGYPPYPPTPEAPAAALAEQIKAQAYRDAGLGGAPYTEAFAGTGGTPTGVPPFPPTPVKRFPVGALWLIALGILVLVGNLSSEWRISGLWVLAGLFAALAGWTLMRRLEWAGGYSAIRDGQFPRLVGMLRAPIMFLTLSILFLLQAAHIATFGQTWPVFPIAFGFALLLERTVGAASAVPLPPVGSYYAAAGNAPIAPAPVAATESNPSRPTDVQP